MEKNRCYVCGAEEVIWDSDVDADAVDGDLNGIIHYFHCARCGTRFDAYELFEKQGGNDGNQL